VVLAADKELAEEVAAAEQSDASASEARNRIRAAIEAHYTLPE